MARTKQTGRISTGGKASLLKETGEQAPSLHAVYHALHISIRRTKKFSCLMARDKDLHFNYLEDPELYYRNEDVHIVRFPISRRGNVTHDIAFESAVTVKAAVRACELFLSERVTEEYYNTVFEDDDAHDVEPWDTAFLRYRGECLMELTV
jgi:hypothetical protein